MASLFWRCDFCSHTVKSKESAEAHEKACAFNPATKECHSCRFHDIGYGVWSASCENGVVLSDVEFPCELWEPE
jgi:hypothetical protein